ncbi:MAG TPA: S-methyl-5'-thioadenosine phosphorylase, partial [bacterium]|nr:S-methyl-5'-thioadenosine phosphorylase [bacterium]
VEICYVSIFMAIDYDCWHEEEEAVTSDAVMKIVRDNSETAKKIIKAVIPTIPEKNDCVCSKALATSLVTERKYIPTETYEKVKLFVGKYYEKK